MLNYSEIFNIKKTTLPLSKKEMSTLLTKRSFIGYVQCSYSNIIQTLKDISTAQFIDVSINPEKLYADSNNPFHKADVIIAVEGLRTCDEFVDNVISTGDSKEWTDFTTYSETFKDELRNLKCKIIHNILWNTQNLNNWFEKENIALLQDEKDSLATDWEKFKENVLCSTDLYSFIDSCNEEELQKATKLMTKNLLNSLQKYRHELSNHVLNNTKRELTIKLKNPIVNRIFVVSNYANQCAKEWPKLRFTSLDKRSFDSLSLWDE